MEKCEKRREQGRGAARWGALHGEVDSINGAAATGKMRACSACAGDYEDPDRTAWPAADDVEDEEHGIAPQASAEEFPAEE